MGFELLSLVLPAAILVGGTLATYSYDSRTLLLWRIPIGACLGLTAAGLIGFALAMRVGLTDSVVAVSAAAVACPAGLLLFRTYRERLRVDVIAAARHFRPEAWNLPRSTVVRAAIYAAGIVLLWWVAGRSMFVRPDGIYTGVSNNIGDLPFHLTVTQRFLHGANFPPEHPSYAGVGFTYPFLTDYLGAMFVRTGIPIREVVAGSTWLLCVTIAALLYRWTYSLTRSRDAAFYAPCIALLSGGLGWWEIVPELWAGDAAVWSRLASLPHDYTITSDGEYRWGNLVTALLVTQRGLLLAIPLALIVLQLWWESVGPGDDTPPASPSRMTAAGVIVGMLPLVHAHTFVVLLGMGACLALLCAHRWRWTPFFLWAVALGVPQVWWLAQASGVESSRFIEWWIGWDRGNQNVVVFWLKNTGLFIPLLCAALLWHADPAVRRFYLPFTLCFIVPNLLRLAPWIWDNIKILVYWFIASVPLVALTLARLRAGSRWGSAVAGVLLISLTLAGFLDVWRAGSGAFQSRVFDREGIEFAAEVMRTTEPQALILHAPMPNHPIALTGRRSLMGYTGHVWSHGLDPGPREADIKRMYSGGAGADVLLKGYGIEYVALGPPEIVQIAANANFFERYERVVEAGGYRLYRIARGTD
jgi:hypothetical protein